MLILNKLNRYISRRDRRDILITMLNTSIVGIHKFHNIIDSTLFIYIDDIQYHSGCMILNSYRGKAHNCDYDYTPHDFIDITYKLVHKIYSHCCFTIQKIDNKWRVGNAIRYYPKK